MKMEGWEREKKREILGGPAEGGPGLRGPLAKIDLAPPKSVCQQKIGQAMAQIGQAKVGGQSWPKLAWSDQNRPGIFKDVRFYLHDAFWPFFGLPSPLTFHDVNNHGGRENCQGTKNKRKRQTERKQQRKTLAGQTI